MSLDGSGLALLLQLPPLFLLLLMLANPSLQQGERLSACGGASYQIDPARPNNVVAGLAGAGAGAPRYQLVNMDALVKNACSPAMPAETPVKVYPARYVIVRCEECARCPQELGNLRRVLVQIATEAKLLSLIVMLGKDLVRPDSQRSPTTDSGVVRFVLSNDDDGLLTFCDPADAGDGESLKSFSKTSVLFVSISFIILIVISLAWLVFYYVQRFRYAHAKDRLQRRLFNAAKKALARIPTRPVKAGDKELSSDCPVCIDPYKPGDICRQLPCRHIFHKSCVDPWLLEHRTCPMCKSDILKAFGYHVSGRRRAQFSANVEEDGPTGEQDMDHRRDREDRLSIESTGSESANPFPAFTEVHDPFGFSPATSPQLIQMVNSNGFQVIPLAVPPGGNPHCEIIEAPIERHSTCEHPDETHPAVAEHQTGTESVVQQTRNGVGDHPQPQTSSTGLRLFRAVTGRRHASATQKLQQMNRSRSFSQSQISPLKLASGTLMSNEADGTKAIIFSSVNSNESLRPKELPSVVLDSGKTKNPTPVEKVEDVAGPAMSNSRAVTAPGGFRRKVGSSQGKSQQQECGHEQRATETRVDMSGTL